MRRELTYLAAKLNEDMADACQRDGRFYWEGITGDIASTNTASKLALETPSGTVEVSSQVVHGEWDHAVAIHLPDHALRPVIRRLQNLLKVVAAGEVQTWPVTVH